MLPPIQYKRSLFFKSALAAIACLALFCVGFFAVDAAFAQSTDVFGLEAVDQNIALGNSDIRVIVMRIIRAALGLLGIIALVIILYAGYTIMTSGGQEDKISSGKKILINGIIGLAIILSAFSIVSFILNRLSDATGMGAGSGVGRGSGSYQGFSGSGALGRIIKDHYPARNQTNVSRNTRVAVTFREPVDPSSFIENTNNTCWGENGEPTTLCQRDASNNIINPYFGDCALPPREREFDWARDCDKLKDSVVKIYASGENSDDPTKRVQASAMATYNEEKIAMSFVFRPLSPLGNEVDSVKYTVDLTAGIKKSDGRTGAFSGQRSGHYWWEFEVSNIIDVTPPTVSSVFPRLGAMAPRNTVVKIDFSEPMDPVNVQGVTDSLEHLLFWVSGENPTMPNGEWKISNGYRTVEFVSNEQCGVNSCGEPIYCLPISNCQANNQECSNEYQTLARTARLIVPESFESLPFSGVSDMSGNALDGDRDGIPDGKPEITGDPLLAVVSDRSPDNYSWNFTVKNTLDLTLPYIVKASPGIDQEGVTGDAPLKILFNLPMWQGSFDDVSIREYPDGVCSGEDQRDCLDEIWFRPLFSPDEQGRTEMTLEHREFGPNGTALYYFPIIPSSVKASNQQCFYPGRGPMGEKNTSPTCSLLVNEQGELISSANCLAVNPDDARDTACVQTADTNRLLTSDTTNCVSTMEELSPTE